MRRRRFLQRVVGDGVGFLEEISGRPQLRLKDLWQCPDEILLSLRPAFVAGATVYAVNERMLGRHSPGDPIDLYGLDEPGTFVLSRFDGRSPLVEIASELASARGWDAGRARAHAREVFLRLVAVGLCAPANPLTAEIPAAIGNFRSSEGEDHE